MTTSPRVAFALGLTLGLFVALGPACSNGSGTGGGTGGSGGSGVGGGTGGGTTTAGFCGDFAVGYCDFGVRCGFVSAAARAECVTYATSLYCAGTASITKGYVTLDSAKATACINSLKGSSCDLALLLGNGDCASVTTPNANSGQACFNNNDCKSASEGCGGNNCMQTCGPTGAMGQPCPKTASCNTGLRCDYVTNTCVGPGAVGANCSFSGDCDSNGYCDTNAGKCVALPTAGQPCSPNSKDCASSAFCNAGNLCQTRFGVDAGCTGSGISGDCQTGLFCDFSKNPDSCQPRLGNGAACQTFADSCQTGLRCISNTCQTPKAAGVSCSTTVNDCADGLTCDDVLRTCQSRVYDLMETQVCTGDARNCGSGLHCAGAAVNPAGGVGTVGMCVVPKVGDACRSRFSTECPQGSFCNLAVDGGPGTCVAGSLGSPCSSARQCLEAHYCEAGLCAERKPSGSTCTSDSACQSPLQCLTNNPDAGTRACAPQPDVGQACISTTTSGCKFPNLCVNGTCVHGGKTGEKCLSSGQCLNGKCDRDAGICQGPAGTGADCQYASDCSSLRCFKGKCEAPCP